MKLPLITGKKLCKIVLRLGFVMVHRKGSHTVWKHPDGRTTTIPVHSAESVPFGAAIPRTLSQMQTSTVELRPYDNIRAENYQEG
ncbi:MAG: type II toxin-antitoxin system HicA family toxin [Candidatus Thermoplasmatota archaeon]|jgi:predicted RNA binding protein YcfA (HicA-like mRNA interferase family)|nr:type II toxin-antitoxin system HicA family toxin [Candidatus Thermoplasmatota archaeon]MDP7264697.1 type II toxin-antitoxin system HicA family toxin [Candidatus Thermoplasmatota archaeon]